MTARIFVMSCIAAIASLSATTVTFNDLSSVTDPSDPTNGGYWTIAERAPGTNDVATSGMTSPVNGVSRSVDTSAAIALRTDRFDAFMITIR